jgi:hypothetical protein
MVRNHSCVDSIVELQHWDAGQGAREAEVMCMGVRTLCTQAELMDTDPQPFIYWDRKQFTHFSDQVRP